MVGSVGISSNIMPQQISGQQNQNSSSLTTSQKETISSVLEQFDSSNLSSSDAASIIEAFQDAGIEPSKELESAMSAQGFDAQEVGKLGGAGGPQGAGGMPPPPPPSDEEEYAISTLLDTLFSTEDDDEDEDSTSISSSGSSFDEVMEYTSRILNLNDKSKTEVMDMLEKYSLDNSEFTKEENANILKNSLTTILSDTDNYNRVSFYA